ncbi:MAG: hypothetical protein Q4C30_00335 [Bacteroidia bacterium]|nr:hypothetical protein [Bacteroidia bacterium]
MSTIDDFIKEVSEIRHGTELRDFLSKYENYYIEALDNYALLTPEFITLTNVDRLYIDLHAPFASFHMPIFGFIVVPSHHVSVDELMNMAPEDAKVVETPYGDVGVAITLK